MTEEALKPCPFCGGDDFKKNKQIWGGTTWYSLKCTLCTAKVFGLSREAVINQWNTRSNE